MPTGTYPEVTLMADPTRAPEGGHPVFAFVYDAMTRGAENRVIGSERRRLILGCEGRVLELGAGTGASFPAWLEAVSAGRVKELVAVEPDVHMRRRAQARARALGLTVAFEPRPAEALPFPDHAFDTVAAFLVLCSVTHPAQALAQALRVLRPGGTLVFMEHVRADGRGARWQGRLAPVWARVGAGCRLDRDTVAEITSAGFTDLSVQYRPLPFPLYRLAVGSARRPKAGTGE